MSRLKSFLFPVDHTEEIVRIIHSPSMVENGTVSMGAFQLTTFADGTPEEYLSVWRIKYRIPTRKNAKRIRARKEGDSLFGYASLMVSDVNGISNFSCKARVLRNDPNPTQYHVGIYYSLNGNPVSGECYDPDFMLLTLELAARCNIKRL